MTKTLIAASFITAFIIFIVSFALGWTLRPVYEGRNITISEAFDVAETKLQNAAESGAQLAAAEAALKVARNETARAKRQQIVAAACPPGGGPISADMHQRLLDFRADRKALNNSKTN